MRSARIPRKTLRKNGSSKIIKVSGGHQSRTLDRFLQRLANIAQPGLLILGLFGYFYTVVPVFQNQHLQEQTAKLGLEKEAAERQLASLTSQQEKVREEIRSLQDKWEQEKELSIRLASDVSAAKNQEAKAQRLATETQTMLQRQLRSLDKARWELVFIDFTLANFTPRYNMLARAYNAASGKDSRSFIVAAGEYWPQPYEDLLAAVDVAEKKGTNRGEIPNSYYGELRKLIKASKSQLQCEKPNFELLQNEYETEIAALESVIYSELEQQIEEIEKRYSAKGQRVKITEDFRSQTKRRISISKEFSVKNLFLEKIDALTLACNNKADIVVTEIRKQKGVSR